jgi:hypothetical protein
MSETSYLVLKFNIALIVASEQHGQRDRPTLSPSSSPVQSQQEGPCHSECWFPYQ